MQLHKLPRTKLTLQKRVATLRTLLAQGASDLRLQRAADKVRASKIQVVRATIGEMPTPIRTPQQNKRIAKLKGKIETLLATTPATILNEFKRKPDAKP
jgi:hypothetical protein